MKADEPYLGRLSIYVNVMIRDNPRTHFKFVSTSDIAPNEVDAIKHNWLGVHIRSHNGLVPRGKKPWPGSMLIQIIA